MYYTVISAQLCEMGCKDLKVFICNNPDINANNFFYCIEPICDPEKYRNLTLDRERVKLCNEDYHNIFLADSLQQSFGETPSEKNKADVTYGKYKTDTSYGKHEVDTTYSKHNADISYGKKMFW